MKRFVRGFTLVEVMASTVVLLLLLTVIAQALSTAQRSWVTVRGVAGLMSATSDAETALQAIRFASLQPRERYDATQDKLVADSDLHFVCGPASQLIPTVQGACGDAIFFQRPAREGALSGVIQASGFFIQYGDDSAWKPAILRESAPRRRFRLLQFHQPAADLSLFRTAAAGDPPLLSSMTGRAELYAWFAQPITASSVSKPTVSVAAENVLAMTLQALPGAQRCYDTRRLQWDSYSVEAQAAFHRLPNFIDITLLVAEESSWERLSANRAQSIASALIKQSTSTTPSSMTALRDWLEREGLRIRQSVMTISIAEQDR